MQLTGSNRGLRIGAAIGGLGAAGVLVWAGIDALATPAADCDNMAGECLRGSQEAALHGFAAVLLAAAAILLWAAMRLLLGKVGSRVIPVVVVAGAVLAIAVVAVKPADQLDNRFEGWLADGAVWASEAQATIFH